MSRLSALLAERKSLFVIKSSVVPDVNSVRDERDITLRLRCGTSQI